VSSAFITKGAQESYLLVSEKLLGISVGAPTTWNNLLLPRSPRALVSASAFVVDNDPPDRLRFGRPAEDRDDVADAPLADSAMASGCPGKRAAPVTAADEEESIPPPGGTGEDDCLDRSPNDLAARRRAASSPTSIHNSPWSFLLARNRPGGYRFLQRRTMLSATSDFFPLGAV